jgi:predicted nucleic acid-binding protein
MTTYPDSSFLVSLYRTDAWTVAAEEYLARTSSSLLFTPLHRIEVRNALRHAASTEAISPRECQDALRLIDEDMRGGFLLHQAVNWTEVFRQADTLSELHAAAQGQRTLDLLHVALALECGATTFLSFDLRQRKLASSANLKVLPSL